MLRRVWSMASMVGVSENPSPENAIERLCAAMTGMRTSSELKTTACIQPDVLSIVFRRRAMYAETNASVVFGTDFIQRIVARKIKGWPVNCTEFLGIRRRRLVTIS